MDTKSLELCQKRQRLLGEMADLPLLVHGSYLERFSTCAREHCACHRGATHGPRAYVVVYHEGRQRQVYIPKEQLAAIRRGLHQYERLLGLVRQITAINLRLMRAGALRASLQPRRKGGSS